MIEQTAPNPPAGKIVGWAAVNLLAVLLIAYLLAISLASNETTGTISLLAFAAFGGWILIVVCHALFFWLSQINPPGGIWGWIVSGIISSLVGSPVAAFAILGFLFAGGDSTTDEALWSFYLTIILTLISIQKCVLSIVQSLRLKKSCNKVLLWLATSIFGYTVGPLIVFMVADLTHIKIGPIGLAILSTIMVFLVETASGRRLFQVFATSEPWWNDPGFQKAIRAGRSFLADSRRQDLSGQKIVGADLPKENLPIENQKGAIGEPVEITNPKLKFHSARFSRANLEGWDLSGRNFDGADFSKANLRKANLEGVSCEPVEETKMNHGWLWIIFDGLITIVTRGAISLGNSESYYSVKEMKPTSFSEADLTGANLKYAKLNEADFRNAILRQANLTNASLRHVLLVDADLTNAILSCADMSDAILYKTNLEHADLTGAKLKGADLENANLKNAILRRVDLRQVKNIYSANLQGADLIGAILPEVELRFRP